MTEKEKKLFLKQIKKEWEENAAGSHAVFAEEHTEKLQYLYINGYLKKGFYRKKGLEGLVPSAQIPVPLSEKGEKYIHLKDRIRSNSPTYVLILAVSLLGFLTWSFTNQAL